MSDRSTNVSFENNKMNEGRGFIDRYGAGIVLGVLAAYVVLLLIGTAAEVFHLESVLDWWIWRPVGK